MYLCVDNVLYRSDNDNQKNYTSRLINSKLLNQQPLENDKIKYKAKLPFQWLTFVNELENYIRYARHYIINNNHLSHVNFKRSTNNIKKCDVTS